MQALSLIEFKRPIFYPSFLHSFVKLALHVRSILNIFTAWVYDVEQIKEIGEWMSPSPAVNFSCCRNWVLDIIILSLWLGNSGAPILKNNHLWRKEFFS